MTKTNKYISNIAFAVSILLAGEGHSQTVPCTTVKDCLVGVCVPQYGACVGALGESAPVPITSITACITQLTDCVANNSTNNPACVPTQCAAAATSAKR